MTSSRRQSVLHLAGAVIGIAGVAFVGRRIHRDWDQVTDALHDAQPGWLLVALVAGLASMTLIAVNWLALIRARGQEAPARRGLSWFFTGQLGKYVPGGIWPVVGQAELAGRGGVDRRSAYVATISSMAYTLIAAASTAAIAGLLSPNGRRSNALLLGAGVVLGVAVLALPRTRRPLTRLASSVTRGRLDIPTASVVARVTVRHVPVWVMFAAMNICVFLALGGNLGLGLAVDLVFASSASWIIGFVIIGVPGGIGVRESVLVALLTAPIGAPLALSLAVASRLVTIAVDLLGALTAGSVARFVHAPVRGTAPMAAER